MSFQKRYASFVSKDFGGMVLDHRRLTKHKKVEYIELVYDLIFVYLIKRCDQLMVLDHKGFVTADNFEVYLFSILVILQIWAFSTLYINRYGKNGFAEYIFLFLNMYLLCFLAVDTRRDWVTTYVPYQIAWGLIILNLAVQYFRQLRRPDTGIREQRFLMRRFAVFCVQGAAVFLCIPLFLLFDRSFAWLALAIGYIGPLFTRRLDKEVPVYMEHLSERVMLFVVLTFGETLISVVEYFEGDLSPERIYFSVCVFLIVAGMLISYGFIYTKLLDNRRMGIGTLFMFLHVFVVVAINDVTVGLEFMREAESDNFLTLLFLVVSFLMYYATLLFVAHRAGRYYLPVSKTWVPFFIISAVFVAVMFCFTDDRAVNAAVSVIYPFAMLTAIRVRRKDEEKEHPDLSGEVL